MDFRFEKFSKHVVLWVCAFVPGLALIHGSTSTAELIPGLGEAAAAERAALGSYFAVPRDLHEAAALVAVHRDGLDAVGLWHLPEEAS